MQMLNNYRWKACFWPRAAQQRLSRNRPHRLRQPGHPLRTSATIRNRSESSPAIRQNLLNKKKPNKKPPRKTLIHQAVAVSKAVLAVPLAVRPLAPSRGTLEKAQARVLLPAQGAVE